MGRERGRVGSDPGLQTVQEEPRQEGHSQRGDAGVQGRHAGVLRRCVWPEPGAGRGKGCGERRSFEPPQLCVQRQEGRRPDLPPTEQQPGVQGDSSPQSG